MFCELPKDIVWMIIKRYLNDVLKMFGIHSEYPLCESFFYCYRIGKTNRYLFDKTIDVNHEIVKRSLEHRMLIVDCLYPLRLVCRKMDYVLKDKIKVVNVPGRGKQIKFSV
jgi:hypothetical protein